LKVGLKGASELGISTLGWATPYDSTFGFGAIILSKERGMRTIDFRARCFIR